MIGTEKVNLEFEDQLKNIKELEDNALDLQKNATCVENKPDSNSPNSSNNVY